MTARKSSGAPAGAPPRALTLTEYQTTPGVRLSPWQRDALRRLVPSVAVSPTPGQRGAYDLTPGSWVGVVSLGTQRAGSTPHPRGHPALHLEIRPKLPVGQLLFLLAYTLDPLRWRELPFPAAPHAGLPQAIVPAYLALVRRATARGLLHGYRSQEGALPTLRGRLRVEAQLHRHWGRFPPLEVAFDDFTPDVPENRLLKGAMRRLRRLPGLPPRTVGALGAALARFDPVADVAYAPGAVPAVAYGPLNAHYRPAVELARRLLAGGAFELAPGPLSGASLLVDMNAVFEDFVVVALRQALGLSPATFPQGAAGRELRLDRAGAIRLRPDLSWWEGGRCLFVGDVKYKRTRAPGVDHPDLYQLLAYTVASGLPAGLLVYAAGEAEAGAHAVDGKELQVTALDLAGDPQATLDQVATLAGRVRRLRRAATQTGQPASRAGEGT
ncbi:MAG TPA: restriction endonuclease [Chloroflexota bacterium]|nr:restriction endonuclease [Chloroflexota bacterium]